MVTDTAPPSPATPGRPGLSFEAYEQAYQKLSGPDGNPPSQRQLRKYLGTGSNTTLAGYRRRIAETLQAAELPPESGSIDSELISLVQRLARQIALDEAQLAQDRVDEIQADAEQRVRIAETTMEKRLLDTAVLEHRATTAEATVVEQRNTLKAKDEKLAQIEADCQSSREKVVALTQSLENTSLQLGSMNRQHDAQKQEFDQARTENKSAVKQYQDKINNLERELSDSQTVRATMIEQCAGLTTRLEERDCLIETKDTQQEALQQRLERLNQSREASLVQLEEVQQLLLDLKIQLSARDTELRTEKQAHQLSSERLQSALQAVDEKEELTRQLQEALTILSIKK